MVKEHQRLFAILRQGTDNLVVVLSFLLVYYLHEPFWLGVSAMGVEIPVTPHLGSMRNYSIILLISILVYNGTLLSMGAYRSTRLTSVVTLAKQVMIATVALVFCSGFVLYVFKISLSRSFVMTFCTLSGTCLMVSRYLLLVALRYYRAKGRNTRNILITGTGRMARYVAEEIRSQPEIGAIVVGFVEMASPDDPPTSLAGLSPENETGALSADFPISVVANPETFEGTLKNLAIDEVIITEVANRFATAEELATIAVEEGITVSLAIDAMNLKILKSDISFFGSVPLLHYEASPSNAMALLVKRGIDLAGAAIFLTLLSPIFFISAIAIKWESRGPIFFRQERVGLNGRRFIMLKFRSMVNDAEDQLAQLQDQNEMDGIVFKIANDPRITKVGRFIRRTSIDELPQLINVFLGDMSLVGPRPPLATEVSQYQRKQRRRLSMRPGITCIWQVSGRNQIQSFEDWAKLDLEYIDNWSIAKDVELLVKTIPAVLRGSGAH